MRVAQIQTHLLRSRLKRPLGFSQFYYRERALVLVEVTAEDGTTGWGECYGPAEPAQEAIRACVENFVVGQNVFDTELIWHRVWQRYLDHARHGPIMAALSGVDMALWDLKGKLTGLPLHRLLGGAGVEKVPCYATGLYFRPLPEDELIRESLQEAARYVEAGFRAVKIKIGKNLTFDRQVVEALRAAFPHLTLMADANHAYSLNEALWMGRVLEDNGYFFFEEPLAPHALEDYALLRSKLEVAIASGESEQTRFGFRRLIETGGVDIVQPDLAFCGGISEGLKIRALANAFGVDVTPHAWGTGIGFAAALHFHAVAPPNPGRLEGELLFLECDCSENPLREQVLSETIAVEDGYAVVPNRPGLGVEVNQEALAKFQ
ncbi:MAG TPA: mandelate racemase/muconate lactonizing enzyme family protein [Armatimonadetes bacterium]|nr:mandelate racemase/muconate lactonizing enzyme family protein [Armatimonadota bacterium]